MDQSPATNADRGSGAPSACLRQDHRQRDIVENGILMQQHSNTMTAVEFLKARGVEPGVIRRVLLGPERRRALDGASVAHTPQNSI